MYIPSHFAETRAEVLQKALRAVGLFTLVTRDDTGLDASHIPMLLEAKEGPHGKLVGHLALNQPAEVDLRYTIGR
jgi:transcriptional regulator